MLQLCDTAFSSGPASYVCMYVAGSGLAMYVCMYVCSGSLLAVFVRSGRKDCSQCVLFAQLRLPYLLCCASVVSVCLRPSGGKCNTPHSAKTHTHTRTHTHTHTHTPFKYMQQGFISIGSKVFSKNIECLDYSTYVASPLCYCSRSIRTCIQCTA